MNHVPAISNSPLNLWSLHTHCKHKSGINLLTVLQPERQQTTHQTFTKD